MTLLAEMQIEEKCIRTRTIGRTRKIENRSAAGSWSGGRGSRIVYVSMRKIYYVNNAETRLNGKLLSKESSTLYKVSHVSPGTIVAATPAECDP